MVRARRLIIVALLNANFLKLIRLQSLFTHTAGRDIKVVTVMMSYADVAISTGNPIALVSVF
jgi:hypothetical protein